MKSNVSFPQSVPPERTLTDDHLLTALDLWSFRLERWQGFLRDPDDPRSDPHGDRRALLLAGVEAAERNVWRLSAETRRRGLPL